MKRIVEKQIEEALLKYGAVYLEGPMGCGKQAVAGKYCKSAVFSGKNAQDRQLRQIAKLSPEYLLEGDYPRLIQEWQEIPEVWNSVIRAVDEGAAPGSFIMTSSFEPVFNRKMLNPADRVGLVSMDTLTLSEMDLSDRLFTIQDIFDGNIDNQLVKRLSAKELESVCKKGGLLNINSEKSGINYLESLMSEYIVKIDNKRRDAKKLWGLLYALGLAENTVAKKTNLKKLALGFREANIDVDTITDYLEAFDRMHLISNQEAYVPKLNKTRRVFNAPRRHFCDPLLAILVTGMYKKSFLKQPEYFANAFSALCIHDISIYAKEVGCRTYHYHDEKGNAIDIVLEHPDGRKAAFKTVLSDSDILAAKKELLKIQKFFVKEGGEPFDKLVVICGLMDEIYSEDGVIMLPFNGFFAE